MTNSASHVQSGPSRAPTPSAAAELVSSSRDEWVERFQTCLFRLTQGILLYLEREKSHLKEHLKGLQDPKPRIEGHLQRLDELDGRMRLGFHHVLLERRRGWLILNQGLRHLNPVEVIRRSSLCCLVSFFIRGYRTRKRA